MTTRTERDAKAAFQLASKKSMSKDRVEYYDSWAETYEKDHNLVNYSAPRQAVDFLSEHYAGNPEEARVLDVACGTGFVARRMSQLGFKTFDGVDGSKGMLDKAAESGIYQNLYQTLLGTDELPTKPGVFDVVIIVGGLRPGLVPITVIRELYQTAKDGAYICMSRIDPKTEGADEYKQSMEKELKLMEEQQLWTLVATKAMDKYMVDVYHKDEEDEHYLTGTMYLYMKKQS